MILSNHATMDAANIMEMHIKETCSKVWCPPMSMTLASKIIFSFSATAFVDEMEGIVIYVYLLWAVHRILLELPRVIWR